MKERKLIKRLSFKIHDELPSTTGILTYKRRKMIVTPKVRKAVLTQKVTTMNHFLNLTMATKMTKTVNLSRHNLVSFVKSQKAWK